jgi:uncharacterized membrane protein YagU involved in acid resistance
MNWGSWLLWGFVSTIVLTTLMAGSQGLGLTRMNLPYLLGSMMTPSRDRAQLLGIGIHLVDGWLFSLIYVAAFHAWHQATWWRGALIGLVHGGFVVTAGLWMLPGLHPRMASEEHGPTVVRQLEPPGFLGLNYGSQTPVSILISHVIYGLILGAFYEIGPGPR